MEKPQLTSITTVKCNGFISKVASLSDVKYTGVSYLGIFIRDRWVGLIETSLTERQGSKIGYEKTD